MKAAWLGCIMGSSKPLNLLERILVMIFYTMLQRAIVLNGSTLFAVGLSGMRAKKVWLVTRLTLVV